MKTHKDLDVWNQSIDMVEAIYQFTKNFPAAERYSLISQMRRSAIAVPSNIAEGYARQSTKELIQFLYVSLGSLSELETQIIISRRLNYLNSDNPDELLETIRRKLLNLIKFHKGKL